MLAAERMALRDRGRCCVESPPSPVHSASPVPRPRPTAVCRRPNQRESQRRGEGRMPWHRSLSCPLCLPMLSPGLSSFSQLPHPSSSLVPSSSPASARLRRPNTEPLAIIPAASCLPGPWSLCWLSKMRPCRMGEAGAREPGRDRAAPGLLTRPSEGRPCPRCLPLRAAQQSLLGLS